MLRPLTLQPSAEQVLMDLAQDWMANACYLHMNVKGSSALQESCLRISDVLCEAAGWTMCPDCGDWFHGGKKIRCICDTCPNCGGDKYKCDCYNLWLVNGAEAPYN